MKIICVIFLVFLIGIASVSALSVNPAAIPALKTVDPTPQPTVVAVHVKPVTIVSDVWVTLEINSLPSGARVTVDGQSTLQGTTPYKIALHPGSHTILLTLDGYKDYSTIVNLQAGYPVAFDAQLQRALTVSAIRDDLSAVQAAEPQPGILRSIKPGAFPTLENTDSCISGQNCLTLAEAGEMYAPGWYYAEGSVCGHAVSGSNVSVPKYCISGSAKMTLQPGAAQAAVSIKPENTVKKVNATHDIAGNLPLSPSPTPRILGAQRQVGFVEAIFGFFNGLFGKNVPCPSDKVNCDGGCVDTYTDWQNCGTCGMTCFDPAVCCDGECVDLQEDEMNCGRCGMTCFDPAVCWYGNCDLEGAPLTGVAPTQPVQELVIPSTTPLEGVALTQTPQELVIPTTTLRTSPIVI